MVDLPMPHRSPNRRVERPVEARNFLKAVWFIKHLNRMDRMVFNAENAESAEKSKHVFFSLRTPR